MGASITASRAAVLILILTGLVLWSRGSGVASAQPARVESPGQPAPGRLPEAGTKTAAPQDPQLLEIDHRIRAMREELRTQLEPLDAQVKALHEKYDSQIQGLVTQRKTLVEQGKPSAIQQLDVQEDAELASLSDHEKAEIEKVKQSFADERKDVQRKYETQRKDLGGRH